MRHLATVRIESLTPSAIGGYDPNIHDDIFRVTSLRGVAAWWLRAIISGAAYDKGDVRHREKAIQIQERVFGATSNSSLITIKTKEHVTEQVNARSLTTTDKKGRSVAKHIRLRLLLMGEQDPIKKLDGMLRNFRATIDIYSSAKEQKLIVEEALGLHAILLSLLLGGLGKGSRRGLGAVKLRTVSISREVKEFLQDERCEGLLRLPNGVNKETLRMVIDDARRIAEMLLKDVQAGKLSRLPDIPSLSRRAAEIYITRINKGESSEGRLAALNTILEELFLRSPTNLERLPNKLQATRLVKKNVREGAITVSEATALGSYILGLPRAAKSPPTNHQYSVTFKTRNTENKQTRLVKSVPRSSKHQYSGFVKFDEEKGVYDDSYRRPSPVIVSMLDEQTAVITLFKSSDWPEELQWFTSNNKSVKALSIDDAYSVVSQYLMKHYEKVWPQ